MLSAITPSISKMALSHFISTGLRLKAISFGEKNRERCIPQSKVRVKLCRPKRMRFWDEWADPDKVFGRASKE
jgi:hypothetical protein